MFVSGPVFLFQKVENQHMTVPAGIVSQNLERMKIKPENLRMHERNGLRLVFLINGILLPIID